MFRLLILLLCLWGTSLESSPINQVLLTPTETPFYEKLQKEFAALEHNVSTYGENKNRANLALAENIDRAPTLHTFLTNLTENLIQKTKLKMPTIYIYLGDDVDCYNAKMETIRTVTTCITPTTTGNDTTKIVSYEYNLVIGKELINLFFWNNTNKHCLPAVIAHEIGHAVNEPTTSPITNEFKADATAIKILDQPQTLPLAIDMLTLAGHMYNNIITISPDAPKTQVNNLVHIMTSSLIQEFPDMGMLGAMSSHHNLAFTIYTAIEPMLKPEAQDGKSITLDYVVTKAYNQLKQACAQPEQFLKTDQAAFSAKGKLLDALTNSLYSPITHPDPKSRKDSMKKCIAARMA